MSPPKHMKQNDSDSSDSEAPTKTDFSSFMREGKGLSSAAYMAPDGTITVKLNLNQKLPELPTEKREVSEFAVDASQWRDCPRLNIVIMIVGSRGDVQPYVALGKRLVQDGHRIRIASHETFRSFVNDAGLEFYNIGGNPQDLMSYMVKNPGLMPGMESLTNGDIGRKRKMLEEMIDGCWMACHAPCQKTGRTFAADAIISNPPAFAHVHCAEALGIPLQLSFTMPWTPTTAFPHPLVNVSQTNAEPGLTNYLTYPLAEIMTWQGIGDIINNLRKRHLGLKSLSLRSGPGLVDTLKVPWTYCMSPALVPKPKDWNNHIDVCGFYFLDLGSTYTPPDDLAAFLAAGPAPLYIGFGSVVVDDPAAMSKTIFDATARAGVRALVSAGWGGLGGTDVPSHIFILGNVPHDWLFAKGRVAAVIHHGGAGTTAVGLANGRPSLVVPFFGDQGFWGSMINKAGAGPKPIPPKKLNVERLQAAIEFLISDEAKVAAAKMAEQIRDDDGVNKGAESFYKHLPIMNMRCDLDPSRVAVWWSTEHCLKLSALAAQTLVEADQLDMNLLECHRPKEYDSHREVTDPVSGGGNAIFWTVTHYYAGIAEIFYSPINGVIHTTTAIPKGVMKIVSSVQEGFHNAPKLYGSEVRKPEKVTGFTSGLKAGGKGLFNGYYDGITGLVREPLEGAKKEGFMGAIKGSARSFVNVTMKPAAGIVGMIAHPVHGAWQSMRPDPYSVLEMTLRVTRVKDGLEASRTSSSGEKDAILKAFRAAKGGLQERKDQMAQMVERAIAETPVPPSGPPPMYESVSDVKHAQEFKEADYDAMFQRDLEAAMKLSQGGDDQEAEEFRVAMEQAKIMSLADSR